ncbi:hypothetical protein [Aliivibrio fischeri]|uniref:hypothetical protein n=1 Tax=Aliivibrio fischeri TaxID=668 RepID=UPI0007C57C59|nr:hypothetical protein [Aliivibrio fischeri]
MNKKMSMTLLLLITLTGCMEQDSVLELIEKRSENTEILESYVKKHSDPNRKLTEGTYLYVGVKYLEKRRINMFITKTYLKGKVIVDGHISGRRFFIFPFIHPINAIADYTIDDGLIKYTNVVGDGILFPKYNVPFAQNDGVLLVYNFDSDNENGFYLDKYESITHISTNRITEEYKKLFALEKTTPSLYSLTLSVNQNAAYECNMTADIEALASSEEVLKLRIYNKHMGQQGEVSVNDDLMSQAVNAVCNNSLTKVEV